MIIFEECQKPGYPARTEENIIKSDATIAFAIDFRSRGEILTEKLCDKHSKIYIPVRYDDLHDIERQKVIAAIIIENDIKGLNGVGNGIYTLKEEQKDVNQKLSAFLLTLLFRLGKKEYYPTHFRSGGQTGVDTGFLMAAEFVGFDNIHCLAPKGWMFRDINHKDIKDEQLFKQRFEV